MAKSPHEVGFVFPEWKTLITSEDQIAKLKCCGIKPNVFANFLDVTALASQSILATAKAGYSINGMVHMAQRFQQNAPIPLGEPLLGSGRVIAVKEAARGDIIISEFAYERSDGTVPMRTYKTSLRLDPSKKSGSLEKKSDRKVRSGNHRMDLLLTWQLVPKLVAEHSKDADNLIHSDPHVAKYFGFRAPIAGGLMAAHHTTAVLARNGVVNKLDMTISFRRPMFWDDKLDLFASSSDVGVIRQLKFLNGNGKVVNDCLIDKLSYV